MGFVLVRHADAVPEEAEIADACRYLTSLGRKQARSLGIALRSAEIVPTAVLASPLVRAVQTAELLCVGASWEGSVEILASLAPTGNSRMAAIRISKEVGDVIVVGHEPHLSGLAMLLTPHTEPRALKRCEALILREGKAPTTILWSAKEGT